MGRVVHDTEKTDPAMERSTPRVIVVFPAPDGPEIITTSPLSVSVERRG
jgi:hypothetical protein